MRKLLAVIAALVIVPAVKAWDYNATGQTTEQSVQLRAGADFSKKWKSGLQLSIAEDLRFNLYDAESGMTTDMVSLDTTYGASFNKSYTTLTLSYAHPSFNFLKIDAGYTLRLLGDKGWSDPNKFLRHRVFGGVTASYRNDHIKLYLRERVVCDMRTDSVNLLEKNRYNCFLRSRLGAEFVVPGKPLKPYLWTELENTLNAPEYQRKNGQQYISHVRTQAGLKWRLTQRSSLEFYYRFQYGYNRDINITKKKELIELTEEKSFMHAIGITYHFN